MFEMVLSGIRIILREEGEWSLLFALTCRVFFTAHGCDPDNRCAWITILVQERLLGFF